MGEDGQREHSVWTDCCGERELQLMAKKLISRLADHDPRGIPICLVCDVLQALLSRKFFLFL